MRLNLYTAAAHLQPQFRSFSQNLVFIFVHFLDWFRHLNGISKEMRCDMPPFLQRKMYNLCFQGKPFLVKFIILDQNIKFKCSFISTLRQITYFGYVDLRIALGGL